MCQRRQKSCTEAAVYGALKLSGNSKPRSSETPMAMSA